MLPFALTIIWSNQFSIYDYAIYESNNLKENFEISYNHFLIILSLIPFVFHLVKVHFAKKPDAFRPLLKQLALSVFLYSILIAIFLINECKFFRHTLNFIMPGKTSRDVLSKKDSWFLVLKDAKSFGIGECSIIPGLSLDNIHEIELKLKQVCNAISKGEQINYESYNQFPAVKFAIETALKGIEGFDTPFHLFNSDFSNNEKGIPINGLIWMGQIAFMKKQIKSKLDNGFNCLKLKVGSLEFESEINLLKNLRKEFLKKI